MIIFVDDVGVSSIFSSVMTCAVAIEPNQSPIKGARDSKQLSKKQRENLYPIIASQVQYAFGSASPKKIEQMNIHFAKLYAMKLSVEKLAKNGVKIDKVVVDGKFSIPDLNYPQEAIVKADDKFWGCSCASILAKVHRDNMIAELTKTEQYSHYDLENNAGYFSPNHKDGIVKYGGTELHRKGFMYYRYCLFCHNKYLELLKEGKTYKDYLEFEKNEEVKYRMSFYYLWKKGKFDDWGEVKYGDEK